ncbi:transposase [Streptomyces canus]|uniref:transposase n=1 Tax=Streptomyces canus TaxID=58343 RepID=UPI0033A59336
MPWLVCSMGQSTRSRRIIGRKRHLGCDTLVLLLTVLDTAAGVSDTAAGVTLLTRVAAAHPHITKAWVDAGYRTTAIDHGARLGIDVHPLQRPPGHPHRSEAMIHLVTIDLMARALTGEATPNWRGS